MMINAKMRKDINFIARTQKICKVFRSEICNVTLQEMGEFFGVSFKSLSAWEHGRSNKAEYIFFYYDLCEDEITKENFLNLVFNSDGKDIAIDTTKNIEGKCTLYAIHLKERN